MPLLEECGVLFRIEMDREMEAGRTHGVLGFRVCTSFDGIINKLQA